MVGARAARVDWRERTDMMNARKYVVSALVACAFWLAAGPAHASTKVKADFNGDGFEDLAIGVPGQTLSLIHI